MMKFFTDMVADYTQMILAENADYVKQYEVRPGLYSNVDPQSLCDVKAADFDINR